MQKQSFSNTLYKKSIRKIEDDRAFYINEATEKANLSAIICISNLQYMEALIDASYYEDLRVYFSNILEYVTTQHVRTGDYDFINQATLDFDDYLHAADFLTSCKLFIKLSSDYELVVDHDKYTFYFNMDRIAGDMIYDN